MLLLTDSRRAGLQPPTSGQRTDTAVMDACRLAMLARSGCARWQVPGCVRLWAVNQWEVLGGRTSRPSFRASGLRTVTLGWFWARRNSP